jgi:hypothetical protein
MAQPKLSISADEHTVAEIKAAAEDEANSISAWMIDAAQAKLRNRALRVALNEALSESQLTLEQVRTAYERARESSILVNWPQA